MNYELWVDVQVLKCGPDASGFGIGIWLIRAFVAKS